MENSFKSQIRPRSDYIKDEYGYSIRPHLAHLNKFQPNKEIYYELPFFAEPSSSEIQGYAAVNDLNENNCDNEFLKKIFNPFESTCTNSSFKSQIRPRSDYIKDEYGYRIRPHIAHLNKFQRNKEIYYELPFFAEPSSSEIKGYATVNDLNENNCDNRFLKKIFNPFESTCTNSLVNITLEPHEEYSSMIHHDEFFENVYGFDNSVGIGCESNVIEIIPKDEALNLPTNLQEYPNINCLTK